MLIHVLPGFVVAVLDSASTALATELDSSACLELGFNSAKLLCSACDDLKQFGLGMMSDDCGKCCMRDAGSAKLENVKYERAVLEVCGWRLGAYPQVAAFVKSELPARYPGLTIKYVRGADPIIKLIDDEDEVAETLAIDKWNTDSVEEFLDTVMVKSEKLENTLTDRETNEI